jgi:hypothetical protein
MRVILLYVAPLQKVYIEIMSLEGDTNKHYEISIDLSGSVEVSVYPTNENAVKQILDSDSKDYLRVKNYVKKVLQGALETD